MPPAGEFIALSSGNSHNCAITISRDLVCWGDDSFRQSEPPAGKFIAVSAGASHNCGITTGNDVVCWGSDLSGQRTPPQIIPLAAEPVTITAAVSASDMGQISLSANQAVIPAGATQTTLTVTVTDDDIDEPDTRHLVELGVEGHARLDTNQVIVTAPANDRRVGGLLDLDGGAGGMVAENSTIGASVGITAQAANATNYTLIDDADGRFAISATGLVTVADGNPINFEQSTQHTITVQAGNRFAETASTTLAIQIVNVNEITLRDLDSRNNFARASTGAVAIGITLEAVHDEDDQPITAWELPSDSPFEITQAVSSSTQGLRIKADAENLGSRIDTTASLRVIARTRYDEIAMISTIRFTEQEPFFVEDIEDIDGEAGGMVAENSPIGTPVGITVRAAGATSYTLTDNAGGRFMISSTGFVTVADGSLLDYETATSHSITAQASGIIDSRSRQFTIYVTDVDEFALGPITDSDPTANTLPEDAAASSRTGITLSAIDEDGSAIVTYMLTDSNDDLFLADTNTGVVTLQGSLNYERSTRHTIIARAMSDDGSSSTATFTVAVTDVNEAVGPVEDIDPADNEIAKEAKAGSTVGITAFAEDPDAGSSVSYSLTENPDSLFAIGPQDGIVTLASGDHQPDRTYTIAVQALSGDSSSSSRRFIISPAYKMLTTATVSLVDDSLAEGDTTTLSVSLEVPLIAAATVTLSHDGNLIGLGGAELVFAPGETEATITVTALNNSLADANTRTATINVTDRSDNISSIAPDNIALSVEPDDEALIAAEPTRLTLNEGRSAEVVFIVSPALAQTATIIAMVSDADQNQIALSGAQLTVAAGQTRSALSITAIDDMLDEEELSHTIVLRVVGHARFESGRDEITVTVPAREQAGRVRLRIRVYLEGALE